MNVFDTVANRFRLVPDEAEITRVIDEVAAAEARPRPERIRGQGGSSS